MLSHKRTLVNLVGYLVVITLSLLTAKAAGAQAPIESAAKAKLSVMSAQPESGAATLEATALSSESNPAKPAANSVKTEAEPPNAKDVPPKPPPPACTSKNTVNAAVVALAQPLMLNRLGTSIPGGIIFALKSDTVNGAGTQLKPGIRPRPLVLRANVGDCLAITFTNQIPLGTFGTNTPEVSLHIQGMEWQQGLGDDGSFAGKNDSSLASTNPPPPPPPASPSTRTYTLYAKEEGTFLLYSMGDTSSSGDQLLNGLFGALNVQPAGAEWYRSQVTADDLQLVTTGRTTDGHPIINYNMTYPANYGQTHPNLPNRACAPVLKMVDIKRTPNSTNTICDTDPNTLVLYHTDLTAIITGPNTGRFPGAMKDPSKPEPACNAEGSAGLNPPSGVTVDPLFCANPAAPDRKQPYRELTIVYHGALGGNATQAFPILNNAPSDAGPEQQTTAATTQAGQDAFAINYGTGGIGAEIYANRIGVGPMGNCVDCKFEEFFLSAWSVGDPAMLVDRPANANIQPPPPSPPPACTTANFENPASPSPPNPKCANARQPVSGAVNGQPYTLAALPKATKAFFPDDPSNVYHSYINDHVKFRILHGGKDVTHVHHQHAHQWLQSPNSDESSYLDSQMISPGASYTLEMVYNGSGNRNKVVGDSIFHCHFYPHFAAGMWAMWRTHDVFESGSQLTADGIPAANTRALPDGEIQAGTPIPAIVPLPTLAMAPLPSPVFIKNGQIVFGTPQAPDTTGQNVTVNPGFPFFIPGIAGARPPHPPLDFACTQKDAQGKCVPGTYLDGGLPRHLITGGVIKKECHTADVASSACPKSDWSKDLDTATAVQLPEDGTLVEKVAMKYFGKRCYNGFLPENGNPSNCPPLPAPPAPLVSTPPQTTLLKPPTGFVLNGLPKGPQQGAPFADPAVDDNGNAVGTLRIYKAAAIQLDVTFNKKGWHYQQQRMLTLWQDVVPTLNYVSPYSPQFNQSNPQTGGRQPEPLFFRGNSGDIIEYWHTNLVPNYYTQDAFQVRTPTDILGQHIHLVKFDVTSSDGAGNGFNYEDGTFSPEEVQELIHAIKKTGGSWTPCAGCPTTLRDPQPPPAEICSGNPLPADCTTKWMGAQTTIQRWYLDPQVDNSNVDRTLRTVFTHDHFGPSTHQQAGLYAGLLVEPKGSTWTSNDGQPFPNPATRTDGGPTSWQARILNGQNSYREFMLEFQDLQLAYTKDIGNSPVSNQAINPPSVPSLVTTGIPSIPAGTESVNYTNEPIAYRMGQFGDLAYAFDNRATKKLDPLCISNPPQPSCHPDPITPLLRAYEGDQVQIRVLVGAHAFAHQFNLFGPTWFSEASWKNSGYRSAQAMGLSEHFELLFRVPASSAPNTARPCPDGTSSKNCVDHLYSPSLDVSGISNGMWGIFRAYDPRQEATGLKALPNNLNAPVTYPSSCPTSPALPPCGPGTTGPCKRVFNITAVTSQKALENQSPFKGQIVFNSRGGGNSLTNDFGVMYVHTKDLDAQGHLPPSVPIEPLVLRANAGDCIEVNLTNGIPEGSAVLQFPFQWTAPFTDIPINNKMSGYVGLHPQLLSYDAATSSGINVGWNTQGNSGDDPVNNQVVPFGKTIKYQWYAGKVERGANGALSYTPVEFGALNLFPSDPRLQHLNGLFGQMIIEPAGSKWACDKTGTTTGAKCYPEQPGTLPSGPTTRASASVTVPNVTRPFREFSVMLSDNIRINPSVGYTAVNYRTEPKGFRYPASSTDFSCMVSNQLSNQFGGGNPLPPIGEPQTPIFTAAVGDPVRFRLTHPYGTGNSQVFSLHGHVWQRNPYTKNSTVIGNNNLSQWLGSRDNHGSTDHFDLLVDKAGGEFGRAGDYLYTVFVPIQAQQGQWGIFRVGNAGGTAAPNGACVIQPPTQAAPVAAKPDGAERFRRPSLNTGSRQ